MEYEEMPMKIYKQKPVKGMTRKRTETKITKKEKAMKLNREQFEKAKATHKAEIVKIKTKRAELKQNVKKHKLQIKQAKLVYKLSKIKEIK